MAKRLLTSAFLILPSRAACAFTYRLIKHAGARNVLFLVDRANLGRQALAA